MIKLNPVVTIVFVMLLIIPFLIPAIGAWRNPDSQFTQICSSTYSMSEDLTELQLGSESSAANYILKNYNFGGSDTQLSPTAHQINRALHILTQNLDQAHGNATICALAVYLQYAGILWVAWIVLSVITLPVRMFSGGLRS